MSFRRALALLLVALAAAVVVRVATEDPPRLAIRAILPARVRLAGPPPSLAWPREGEAAVEVEGVGAFGASGGSTPVPIASVAKVMTAYLTLLQHPLAGDGDGFSMTVTAAGLAEERQRAALGQSILPVRAGETINEREALEALLLPSANNIAAMLAVHDAGSVPAFVALMNTTAARLGMSSTTYTDPSGFEDTTVSTAADQLKLARVAIREPALAAIVARRSVHLPVVGTVANYNELTGTDGYVGVKTGSDRAAGGCLLFAKRLVVAGRRLTVLGIVLGQREGSLIEAALAGAERLGDSAAAAVHIETALAAGTAVLQARSPDGRRTTAAITRTLTSVGWGGLSVPIAVSPRPPGSSVRAGERLATVRVPGATTAALATRSLGPPGLGWRLRHVL